MDRKDAVRRLFEGAYNDGDFTAAGELLGDEAEIDTPLRPDAEPLRGRAGFERVVTWTRSVWSDVRVELDDIIVEDDAVAFRMTFNGVHTGPLFKYRPSGRRIRWTEIVGCEFAGDRIQRIWHDVNRLFVLQKIGAMPDEWEMGRPPKAIIAVMRTQGRLKRRLAARRARA